jgi:hypothetical protein
MVDISFLAFRKGRIVWLFAILAEALIVYSQLTSSSGYDVGPLLGTSLPVFIAAALFHLLLAVRTRTGILRSMTTTCRPDDAINLMDRILAHHRKPSPASLAMEIDCAHMRILEGDFEGGQRGIEEFAVPKPAYEKIAPWLAYFVPHVRLVAALHAEDPEKTAAALVARRTALASADARTKAALERTQNEEIRLCETAAEVLLVGGEEAVAALANLAATASMAIVRAEALHFLIRHYERNGHPDAAQPWRRTLAAMSGTTYYMKEAKCSPWYGSNRAKPSIRRGIEQDPARVALAVGSLLLVYALFWSDMLEARVILTSVFGLAATVLAIVAAALSFRKGPVFLAIVSIILSSVFLLGYGFDLLLDSSPQWQEMIYGDKDIQGYDGVHYVEDQTGLPFPSYHQDVDSFDYAYYGNPNDDYVYEITYASSQDVQSFADAIASDSRFIPYAELMDDPSLDDGVMEYYLGEDHEGVAFIYDAKTGYYNSEIDLEAEEYEYYFVYFEQESRTLFIIIYANGDIVTADS